MDDRKFEPEMMKLGMLTQTFLTSAKFQAKKISASGNLNLVPSEVSLSEDEYDDRTEADDQNLAISAIYSVYHGVELLLKGALSSADVLGRKNHDLDKLFKKFTEKFSDEPSLVEVLLCVLDPTATSETEPIRKFCSRNHLTPTQFYEALRYPENCSGEAFLHNDLKYNEKDGAQYFSQVVEHIEELMQGFVELSRTRRAYS